MTPKQLMACIGVAHRRQLRGDATALGIAAMGAQGTSEEVNKRIADWSK